MMYVDARGKRPDEVVDHPTYTGNGVGSGVGLVWWVVEYVGGGYLVKDEECGESV